MHRGLISEGHAVRIALAVKGWRQSDLARATGLDAGDLSKILRGYKARPEVWQLIWGALASSDGRPPDADGA
jgi:transcriptional regulator with XRE-family HTH domain